MQMGVQVFGAVEAEAASEDRPVTVAAPVRTAATGNAAGIGGAGIIKNRKEIGLGEPFKFIIGRKRQGVQLDAAAVACNMYFVAGFSIDNPLDFR